MTPTKEVFRRIVTALSYDFRLKGYSVPDEYAVLKTNLDPWNDLEVASIERFDGDVTDPIVELKTKRSGSGVSFLVGFASEQGAPPLLATDVFTNGTMPINIVIVRNMTGAAKNLQETEKMDDFMDHVVKSLSLPRRKPHQFGLNKFAWRINLGYPSGSDLYVRIVRFDATRQHSYDG